MDFFFSGSSTMMKRRIEREKVAEFQVWGFQLGYSPRRGERGKHRGQEKFFLQADTFWQDFIENIEFSWIFFLGENPLFWLFSGKTLLVFFGRKKIHLLAFFRRTPHGFAIASFPPLTQLPLIAGSTIKTPNLGQF